MNKIEFEEVKLKDLDRRLSRLDDFNDFYGWKVYKKQWEDKYILYDNQTGEILDLYHSQYQIVDRISGRALDYYVEEYEWENNKLHISDYDMLKDLLFIYDLIVGDRGVWYENKLKWLKNMQVFD